MADAFEWRPEVRLERSSQVLNVMACFRQLGNLRMNNWFESATHYQSMFAAFSMALVSASTKDSISSKDLIAR